MARAIWTGSLSFGLVNVPVGLYSATEDKSIRFNQFEKGTSDRVRNKRVNERTGKEVAYEDIVKGYDLGGGQYVILTPEELASVAPGPSRTIDVNDFVDLETIDPIYFDRPYYLAPHGKGGERAYELLRSAMAEAKKVAIAHFIMRDKQYLVAVRPDEDVLVLETLRFADEVRSPSEELPTLPEDVTYEPREMEMAKLLIDSMAADWDPGRYHDTYRDRVEGLIDQKARGEVVDVSTPEAEPAPVVNLLEALQASVSAARGGRPAAKTAKAAPAKRTQTKSAPAQAKVTKVAPVAELTKAELMRRATELDIAGRSKMSREELLHAVEAAAKPRRRKAS
jgi:DNA end-binding protein Ku